MRTGRLTIVNWATGDWQALYIDGVLARESHSLTAEAVLEALDVRAMFLELPEGYYDRAPRNLVELPS